MRIVLISKITYALKLSHQHAAGWHFHRARNRKAMKKVTRFWMPTFCAKCQRSCRNLRARSTWPYELTILDFRLYLEGRLSADPLIDPTGDGDDIVNMKPRLSTAWRHHSAEGF